MKYSNRPRIIGIQVFAILFFVSIVALIANFVLEKHRWSQAQLEKNEPLYARLLGLEGSDVILSEADKKISGLLVEQAYLSEQTAVQAGNDAQQRIRSLFVASKLDIVSIQVLPPKEMESFDRIGVTLRVEGDLTGLQVAMISLETLKPTVFIDSISMQTISPAKPKHAPRLLAQFGFSVLRLRS